MILFGNEFVNSFGAETIVATWLRLGDFIDLFGGLSSRRECVLSVKLRCRGRLCQVSVPPCQVSRGVLVVRFVCHSMRRLNSLQ